MIGTPKGSTQMLLEDLERLNPVQSPGAEPDRLSAPRPQRPSRGRRGVAVALTALAGAGLMLIVVALLPGSSDEQPTQGIVATAAAVAAEQPANLPAAGEFAYRSEQWFQSSIPGMIANATPETVDIIDQDQSLQPREGTRRVWIDAGGNGAIRGDQDGAADWPRCSVADIVLGASTHQGCWGAFTGVGPDPGPGYELNIPRQMREVLEERFGRRIPEYSEFGPSINELADDPTAIERAVDELVQQQLPYSEAVIEIDQENSVALREGRGAGVGARLRAIADLLANPLANAEVRAELFRYAGQLDGVEGRVDVTDPHGRTGNSLAVTEAPADDEPRILHNAGGGSLQEIRSNGFKLDLSGLRFRTEIIFDAENSALLAERVELIAADDPLLGAWLERQGSPQAISYRAFEPTDFVAAVGDRAGA